MMKPFLVYPVETVEFALSGFVGDIPTLNPGGFKEMQSVRYIWDWFMPEESGNGSIGWMTREYLLDIIEYGDPDDDTRIAYALAFIEWGDTNEWEGKIEYGNEWWELPIYFTW